MAQHRKGKANSCLHAAKYIGKEMSASHGSRGKMRSDDSGDPPALDTQGFGHASYQRRRKSGNSSCSKVNRPSCFFFRLSVG